MHLHFMLILLCLRRRKKWSIEWKFNFMPSPDEPWIYFVSEPREMLRCKEAKGEKDIWHRKFIAETVAEFSWENLFIFAFTRTFTLPHRRQRCGIAARASDGKLVYKIEWNPLADSITVIARERGVEKSLVKPFSKGNELVKQFISSTW